VLERTRDVVEPVQQAVAPERDRTSNAISSPSDRRIDLPLEVDFRRRSALDGLDQRPSSAGGSTIVTRPDFKRVRCEDVAERRRDDDVEAVVLQRPGACSRDEPQPKLRPRQDRAPATPAGAARTSGSLRQSKKRNSP
jgi:hypothetical protein